MGEKAEMLHKKALRSLYRMQYWTTMGNAGSAAIAKQRLVDIVNEMRGIGEDVDVADYIEA